ncbi:MAG: cytochrome c biogenesis protein CcsA [Muribaculaceae bacterium]|nr:cytochrome c biogenesis protein CcsA [Muribaculaceae bacterium]
MIKQPFTIILHIALAVILAGAIVTHFFGIQGTLTLTEGSAATNRFDKTSGPGEGTLPFGVALDRVEVDYYPATSTPMNFRSVLLIAGKSVEVSMNHVGEVEGWRFYQSGMGATTTTLSVSHDPWGIAVTYTGYALLAIGMTGFFFQRNTPWRVLLRKARRQGVFAFILCVAAAGWPLDLHAATGDAGLKVMQRPLAANMGKVLVYWNDRVCPMQTMARDVTAMLYSGESYAGYTPEQVLSGWLFYFDEWKRDYFASHPELELIPEVPASKADRKNLERLGLVEWLGTGEAFRIYPYRSASGNMEWLSLTGRRPSNMSLEQWQFMQTTMPAIKELLMKGRNVMADKCLTRLVEGQRHYASDAGLPSEARVTAERIYNVYMRPALAGIVSLVLGVIIIILSLSDNSGGKKLRFAMSCLMYALTGYILASMGVLWWIGGHVPVSNGPETMMFMGLSSLAGACLSRSGIMRGGLLAVAGMALLVAAMGGRTPRIGAMAPVLASPLLSLHVMVVMVSYSLFLLMAILSVIGLSTRSAGLKEHLCVLNRLLLTPAVCLLGLGIFTGAVWANQSWGRYWGWDPKEACALVMWLVYALPVHWGSRRLILFRRPKVLHTYLLLAVLTVIFTYFGANYFLGGLHSYALSRPEKS